MKMYNIVFITIFFSSVLSIQPLLAVYAKSKFSQEFKQQAAGISKNAWRKFNKNYNELLTKHYNDEEISIEEIEDILERLERLQQRGGTEHQQQEMQEARLILYDFKNELSERVVEVEAAERHSIGKTTHVKANSKILEATKRLSMLIAAVLYEMQQYNLSIDNALIKVGCADSIYTILIMLGRTGTESECTRIMIDLSSFLTTNCIVHALDLGPEVVLANVAFGLANAFMPTITNFISNSVESAAETLAHRSLWSAFKDFVQEF